MVGKTARFRVLCFSDWFARTHIPPCGVITWFRAATARRLLKARGMASLFSYDILVKEAQVA